MARDNSSTIVLVGLIFTIVVLLCVIALAVKQNSDYEKLAATIGKAQDGKKKAEDRIKELLAQLDEAKMVIRGKDGGSGPIKYGTYQATFLKDAQTQLEATLSDEWIKQEDIDLIKNPEIKRVWNNLKARRTAKKGYDGLTNLYEDLLTELKAVIHVIPRLRAERVAALELVDQEREEKERIRREKQRQIDELRQRLTDEQDKALESARQFDQEKSRLTDEIEKINREKNRAEKIQNLTISRLKSEKNTLKQRIREIIKKEKKTFELSGADGEIVFSEPQLGYAWIDIGKNNNLRPGMPFQVFRYVKGGRKRIKGRVIVKAVEADMAKVTIVEGAEILDTETNRTLTLPRPNDPIVKGDLIRSPLFDRDEQQVFVFLGNKVTNPTYKKKELERKIEEVGGKVDKTVTIGSDFVILLGGAEEEFADEMEKATQFGVIFMREAELLEYLSR